MNQIPEEKPIIQAVGVKRTFGRGRAAVHALNGADFDVPRKRLVALIGRSGSGKTTLMNLVGALDYPSEGSIYFQGMEISSLSEKKRDALRKRDIGFVFQSHALVPYMSAYENVEFGMRIAGISTKDRKAFAEHALSIVGMKERMHHRPQELSGGEQQRVAIARAIAHKPKLILADEPTAELDSKMGMQVIKIFKDLISNENITIFLTTHDNAVMSMVDNVFRLEDGQIVEQS